VDYDGTLVARGRRPTAGARAAIAEARAIGLRVILASGRIHAQLAEIARGLGGVDGLVAENGAVVEAPLGSGPRLRQAHVGRLVHERLGSARQLDVEYGLVIASVPLADRQSVRRLVAGMPVYLEENVDRAMVLPEGVTKASGVRSALRRMGLGARRFAAIGDAHNDVPMLRSAAYAGAVANAEPSARRAADYRCVQTEGRGVREFVLGPLAEGRARRTDRA